MDEFLFVFCTEYFVVSSVKVVDLDVNSFKCKLIGLGETWDPKRHPQGTEVKAITYSNMQINHSKENDRVDIYVIIDI